MTDTFEHQDWNTVTFVKYKQPTQKEKSETQRRVEVATKMSKLDNPDYVPPKPEKVLGKALQKARTEKKIVILQLTLDSLVKNKKIVLKFNTNLFIFF